MIDPTTGSDLSRRSLVKTAGTAAALGGALALAGPAATAAAATAKATPQQVSAPGTPESHRDEPDAGVMVRVIDARLGTLEVYTATGHRTVTDHALAARLAPLGR